MTEHTALLEKEIRELQVSYERAKARPGVKEEELNNIEKKIKLKNEILEMVGEHND